MLYKVLSVGVMSMLLAVMTPGPAPASVQRVCRGLVANIVGTTGDDKLVGTRGPDVVVGLGGNDKLLGRGGDDVLCGGPGADDLIGGSGHDRLYGGHDELQQRKRRTVVSGDLLEGGPGDDLLSVGFDEVPGRVLFRRQNIVSFRHSSRAVTVDLRDRLAQGEGSDVVLRGSSLRVDGSRYDDVLRGTRADDVFDGGRGHDDLGDRGGGDVLLGYQGDDTLDGGPGDDLVISTAGVDSVAGGDGDDFLIAASPAVSTLLGGPGNDYMSRTITSGETGVIDGGPDENQLELVPQLRFGSDRAVLDAEAGTVVVTGEDGSHTTTFANAAAYTLWDVPWTFHGSQGDDFVQVLRGRLNAQGLGGDDYMIGAEGNDVLDGGEGTDAAWGGEGQNTCLNIESGSCTGYPWEAQATRARRAAGAPTGLSTIPPHSLLSRWINDQNLMRKNAPD